MAAPPQVFLERWRRRRSEKQDKKCKESGKAEITVMTAADNASLARLLENERIDLILNDLGLSLGMASNEPTKFRLAFKRLSGFTMAAALTKAKNDDLARAIYGGSAAYKLTEPRSLYMIVTKWIPRFRSHRRY